eukprot:377861_1
MTIQKEITNKQNVVNRKAAKALPTVYIGEVTDVASLITNALEQIHFRFDKCKGVLRKAFEIHLCKLDINFDSFYKNSEDFNEQLISIGITKSVAERVMNNIKKKERIHNKTKKQTFIKFILNQLDDIQDGKSCDIFTQKAAFQQLFSKELCKFSKAIEKGENVMIDDIYSIANNIEIFDHNVATSLSKYLFLRKDHQTPWICRKCQFLNNKLMVEGLWRYFNQRNKCGLCGKYSGDDSKSASFFKESTDYDDEIESIQQHSNIDVLRWKEIGTDQCVSCKTTKRLSHSQLLYCLKNCWFHQIIESFTDHDERKQLFMCSKQRIESYFITNNICGRILDKMSKKDFIKNLKGCCETPKIGGVILQLYKCIANFDVTSVDHVPCADEKEHHDGLIEECPAIQRVDMVLDGFHQLTEQLSSTNNVYPYPMRLYLSSLAHYSATTFHDDVNHIATHKIQHPIRCNKKSCIHLKRATRDRHSEQDQNLQRKKELFNTQNYDDFIFISMLDRAHVILRHGTKSVEFEFKEDLARIEINKIPTYSTGTFIEYHTLKPLFSNLYEELTRHKKHAITAEQFDSELEVSKIFLKNIKPNQWRSCKGDEKYGIKLNEKIHIENVLAIKFYCNYTALCGEFRRSYRAHQNDTDQDVIQRHCNDHYWLGRFLTTAIEFWGQIPGKNDVVYHGIKQYMKFDKFSAVYEMPTSTSWDINVAAKFTNECNGIILQLKPKWLKKMNNSRYIKVGTLSDFDDEKEYLFAGMTVLSITNIYTPSLNKYEGYGEYVASFLYFERIVEQTIHQKRYYKHGVVKEKTKEVWMERQDKYLVPLLKNIMYRNKHRQNNSELCDKLPWYIRALFEHFCDNKRNYIDLSCINEEIGFMHNSLTDILFESSDVGDGDVRDYKINDANIKLIFINLIEYKNHMGYWIYVPKANTHIEK